MDAQLMVNFFLLQNFNLSGTVGSIRYLPIRRCSSPQRIGEDELLLLTYDFPGPGDPENYYNSSCRLETNMNVIIYWQLHGNATGAVFITNSSNGQDTNPIKLNMSGINLPSINKTNKINQNFTILIWNENNTNLYSLVLAIKGPNGRGDEKAEQGRQFAGHRGRSAFKNKCWDFIFLVVVAVLMGMALAFCIVGGILFKLSRSSPSKQEADMKLKKLMPRNTYEVISENSEGKFIVSGKIEKVPPSKSFTSNRSLTEASHTTELSSTLSFDDRASGVSTRANGRIPSPSRSPGLDRQAHVKMSLTEQLIECSNNIQRENYYPVEDQNYEVISEWSVKKPTLRPGIEIATPILLAMNSGGCIRKLKAVAPKAEQGQLRALSSAKATLPTERKSSAANENTYMGLNRTGRAHSTNLTQSENYDDLDSLRKNSERTQCNTAGDKKDSQVSAFTPVDNMKGDHPEDNATYSVSNEHDKVFEMSTEEDKGRDETEEDHIYEAYDNGPQSKRVSSCRAKSIMECKEHENIYELNEGFVIIDARASKYSNIDKEQLSGTPEKPSIPTEISGKLMDTLPTMRLDLPTEEMESKKNNISQHMDEISKTTTESASKEAKKASDFIGASVGIIETSINTQEKSIDSPKKSIDFPEKSIDSPEKSIYSPDNSVSVLQKSMKFPGKTSIVEEISSKATDLTFKTNKSNNSTENSIDTSQKSIDILEKSIDTPERLNTQGISPVITGVESSIETHDIKAINDLLEPGATPSQIEINSDISLQILLENTVEVDKSSGIPSSDSTFLMAETTIGDERQDNNKLQSNVMGDSFQDELESPATTSHGMAKLASYLQTHPTQFKMSSTDVPSLKYTLLEPFVRDDSAT